MHSLTAIPQLPREALVVIGIVAFVLVLWLWARLTRRRYLVIRQSDATEMIALQLGRIADAIERLSVRLESRPAAEDGASRHVSMSMFGR